MRCLYANVCLLGTPDLADGDELQVSLQLSTFRDALLWRDKAVCAELKVLQPIFHFNSRNPRMIGNPNREMRGCATQLKRFCNHRDLTKGSLGEAGAGMTRLQSIAEERALR